MTRKNKAHPVQEALDKKRENDEPDCWIYSGERLRAGMTCPRCHMAKLEYNGLLQLTCPVCGLTEAGAST